ncbi:MAG: tetratricopeptide repeat protein, partial [Myxococcota bacterium]
GAAEGYGEAEGYASGGYGAAEGYGEAEGYASGGYGAAEGYGEAEGYASGGYGAAEGHAEPSGGYAEPEQPYVQREDASRASGDEPAAPNGDAPISTPLATPPVRRRAMSLTERRAFEAEEAADAAMRVLDYKGAESHLERALRFSPNNPDLHAKAAFIAAMCRPRPPAGDKEYYDEEIGRLRQVIKEHPRCETAFYLRGRLFMRLLRRDEAVRDFEKAVRINPENVDAAREIREQEARKKRRRKKSEVVTESPSSFRGVLNWLGIDRDR